MAAASYSSGVLQRFYGSILMKENINLPKPLKPRPTGWHDGFEITQNNFQGWLPVWRMDVSETNPNKRDLFRFARENKEKFTDLVEQEILKLKNVKVSFALEVKFSIERDSETQYMKHYFENKKPHIFSRYDKEEIKEKFDEFIENLKGEIEAWSERGSGWVVEKINIAYVNVARYEPLRGGTYLSLPANLAKKKAIMNVKNRDNECLKWALRAALFPVGKDPQRPSKYPVKDGINYRGIDFPTPVGQIDKLEAQNRNLAINVFCWENNRVSVHRVSKKKSECAADKPNVN